MRLKTTIALFIIAFMYSCKHSKINQNDHYVYFDKVIDSARIIFDKGSISATYKYIDSVYSKFDNPSIGDYWKKYYFKQRISLLYFRLHKDQKQLNESMIYADSMINSVNGIPKYKNELCTSTFVKGDLFYEMGKFEQAYDYFFKGKQLANKIPDDCNKSNFNKRIALIYFKQHKFINAANFFKKEYSSLIKCKIDFYQFAAIQNSLTNAGLSYSEAKKLDSAEVYYFQALKFIDDYGQKFPDKERFSDDAKGVIYQDLGDVYLRKNDNRKAIDYFKQALALNGKAGHEQQDAQTASMRLANLYLNENLTKEAKLLLDETRLSIDSIHNDQAELAWQKVNLIYLNKTKQLINIDKYIKSMLELNNKISKKEIEIINAGAEGEFKNLQNEYELSKLKQERKIDKLYLTFSILFSLMALFIIYQFWKSWKLSKVLNTNLLKLNHQVNEQNLVLQNALSSLEQSQEENKKVMKVVAHDLRSPIGAIVSLAGFMLDDKKLPAEEENMLNLIKNSGSDSLRFVDELLQRESQLKELQKEPVNLYNLVTYCVNLLQYKATEKNQKIILSGDTIQIKLNREKIWRVFSNLITNAIKFSPSKTTIKVNLEIIKNNALITIKDQGIGIPDEMKDELFTISSTTNRVGTIGEQTFGMGLIISKQIIEAHGGKIWYESQLKGTIFYVQLPIT